MKSIPVLAALSLPLLLAACGQNAAPTAAASSGSTTALTLRAPFAGIKAQGVPSDGSGASTVTTIRVKVRDANGQLVHFDGQNVFRADGAQDVVTLTSAAPSATVLLPKGTYSFESAGTSAGGTFLAYGMNAGVDLSAPVNSAVVLGVHALADQTTTTFADKMGWTAVVTQDILDVRLNVLNVDGTLVPSSDYDAPTYQIVDANGQPVSGEATVLGGSKLGARVQAIGTTATTDLYVKATTQAWQATGPDTAAKSVFTKTFRIAFAKTGLAVDMQAPKVSFGGTGASVTAGQAITLSGTASDDSGNVASIRVYNGIELIGSTDSTEFGTNGVGEVSFASGAWTLNWTPSRSGTPDITVVAADKAGNEGRPVVLKFGKTFRAAGIWSSVAVKQDGTVAAWGDSGNGESNVPAGLNSVVSVANSWYHELALKSDGTVVGWGANWSGQTNVPAGLNNVIAVATGYSHSLALKSDGTVVQWGDMDPVPAGLDHVVSIAAHYYSSLALKSDGTVVQWGWNICAPVPDGLSNVVAIAASECSALALKSDGTVVAWGGNGYGQDTIPAGLNNVVAIASGYGHNLALKSDGTVVGWGANWSGQTDVPANLNNVVAISGGYEHSLALKSDGSIVGWGSNGNGQLNIPAGPYRLP
ncbi:hypothetical protein HNQ07_004361 [Deinococcus metalli]|uniref:Chromosome condensation regulator RCC1 n=1 Tax=Deinococcus metalli TaxID=1141878 RepID=A0A7W8KLM3_9DEIO|nr:Ig-like domain-containing protein [Deinococcus metalli]MBB5378854.1 hypothetical protein [Deinococcus metalli]GHF62191.1 hypothetical protein GCM10017781_42840 [Deinococcus metalli]